MAIERLFNSSSLLLLDDVVIVNPIPHIQLMFTFTAILIDFIQCSVL
jgi:hypothetical protein